MKIVDWLVRRWENFYYKRDLKENLVYVNTHENIAFTYNINTNTIKVFTHGLIYNIPIKIVNSGEDYLDAVSSSFDDGLDTLSLSSLQTMLKEYESLEDYDKCVKIRNTITSKLQKNDN